jgi:hypothetical protein
MFHVLCIDQIYTFKKLYINTNLQTTESTVETCFPIVFTSMAEERNVYIKPGGEYCGA